MKALALLLAGLAGKAAGQDGVPVFSAAPTQDCLAAGGGEACIGLSAGACRRPDVIDRRGILFCTRSEPSLWEGEMDRLHERLAVEAAWLDSHALAPPVADEVAGWRDAFRDWRDARCRVDYRYNRDGREYAIHPAGCAAAMTAREVLRMGGTFRE